MGFEHTEHAQAVELSGVVLADGSDRISSAHHVVSLLEAQHLVLGREHPSHGGHLSDMPDDRWAMREGVGEFSFPEGNRLVHARSIEADSSEPAAVGRSLEIDIVLVLQGIHVDLQNLVCGDQKTGLIGAQAVDQEGNRQAYAPGIAAVESGQVTWHGDGEATDVDSPVAL